MKDIFALQDEIVQRIVANLRIQVLEAELERVRRIATDNLTAYDSFLRGGAYFLRFTKETNAQARQMYERAIALDPMYAEAYGFLAWTYLREWQFLWNQEPQVLKRSFELGQKALALKDSLSIPHMLLGHVYLWQKQPEQAIAQAERVISLDPNDDVGYWTLAFILNYAGRAKEAVGLMEKAMRLSPHDSGLYLWELGRGYFLTERYEEAIAALKRSLDRNPDFSPAHINLAVIYSELSREEEARVETAEVLRIDPNFSLEVWRQRLPYKDPAITERLVIALRKAGLK
ncbi:MAG: tetratricopeptide repeat protein [Deltaproteobacteria bacterium]|nr:tetratricopeptide repeat protein [Deltaproteobacteria bacterium]